MKTDNSNTQIEESNGAVFTIDNDSKTITCKQKYMGKYIYKVSKCSDEDVFNPEIGKAIAFAKCELAIRDKELECLEIYIERLKNMKMYLNFVNCKRVAERNMNDLYKKLSIYDRYYCNQKKIVKLLKKYPNKFQDYSDYKQILKDALKTVLGN